MSSVKNPARRRVLRATGVLTAVLVAAGSAAVTFAPRSSAGQEASGQAVPGEPPAGLQQAADQMVADGAPGVIIMSRRGQQVSDVVAGLADTATGQPMQADDRVHIGSITKTFVATVVLQLVAEGRLSLTDSMATVLPGVLTAPGYDPATITVGQLLQQTSGIPDYLDDTAVFNPDNLPAYEQTWQPQQLVDIAESLGPPTHEWEYSNTNYILLGMVIQKVTGQSPITEIDQRILAPLHLSATSFPLTSTVIPSPYAHGYYDGQDVTNLFNPSVAWTAGAMISTAGNVATFYRALLTGQLLPPAQERELLSTIPVDDPGELFPQNYGLGIYSVHLSCGTAWGHDGAWPGGFITIAYTSRDGSRQAVLVYNSYTAGIAPPGGTETTAFVNDQKKALEIAFCGQG